ncbi:recombinase [Spirochaetia bacterium]|nr:recombinase [Spirochaetia bacterium]
MLAIYCRTSAKRDNDGVPTIKSQVKAGIEFAKKHKFDFKVYEDEGKSGYKIDDYENLFAKRPSFSQLLEDIKAQKIDKVWVWEQSRLSRNQLPTAHIITIFQKHKIILFEKDREYNVNDPQVKMFMSIIGSIAEYEREQIVSRMTRGLHDRIDDGRRTHSKLYGYKKTGVDKKGHQILEPVKSEIEKLKVAFSDFLKGNTLSSIAFKLHGKSKTEEDRLHSSQKVKIFLKHFDYTGYSLNMKGLEILKRFDNFEIDSLAELNDEQFYKPSPYYTVKIVSIENWIKVRERLRINRKLYNSKQETRSASSGIATGLIKCGFCGSAFYNINIMKKRIMKKTGELKIYNSMGYHHHVKIRRSECSQYPKAFTEKKISIIFNLFFFYFYLVFDNTKELIEESQKEIKIRIAELEDTIKAGEKEVVGIKKRIDNFNKALESDEIDTAQIIDIEKRLTSFELSMKEKSQALTNNKIILEQERTKFDNNEKKTAYYNTKDKILGFFEANVETQRNEIRQIVDECFVWDNYLLIVANKRLFLFNTEEEYVFDEKAMENLINDKVFMANFIRDYDAPIEQSSILDKTMEDIKALLEIDKTIFDSIDFDTPLDNKESVKDFLLGYEAKKLNNTWIMDLNLDLNKNRVKIQKGFTEYGINYDLKEVEYFIDFENVFIISKKLRTLKKISKKNRQTN